MDALLALWGGEPGGDHVVQKGLQVAIVAVQIVEDAGADSWPSDTCDMTSVISSSVPVPPGEGDEGVPQLNHSALTLRHASGDDELGQAVVLQVLRHEALRLHADDAAALRQCALGQQAHESGFGAAVDQCVACGTDPCAQFPDGLRQMGGRCCSWRPDIR